MSKALAALGDIPKKIYEIRGHRVMLDQDLALLYGVTTGRLNEQVRRNKDRFPSDFMFQLTRAEVQNLKSKFAISRWGSAKWGYAEPSI